MNRLDLNDPRHQRIRNGLRIAGPALLLAGAAFFLVGAVSFVSILGNPDHGGPGDFPRYFWCIFVGIPLAWLGAVLSWVGYGASVSRFLAGQMVPVQCDTFNTLAEGTSEGVRNLARAVGEGFADVDRPSSSSNVFCSQCRKALPQSTKFCPECGKAI